MWENHDRNQEVQDVDLFMVNLGFIVSHADEGVLSSSKEAFVSERNEPFSIFQEECG